MYNTPPPIFDNEIVGGEFSCIINTDFLEFIAARFSIRSTFYWFVLTKDKNLYSLHYMLKHKIFTVFRANTQT